jgi:tape measure domain-containing protein
MTIEREAHLEILIDGSRAKTGADLVKEALESVRLKAQQTLQAMQALNNQRIPTPRRAGPGAAGSAQADVAAHQRAEQQKTAISQREATKRATAASTPLAAPPRAAAPRRAFDASTDIPAPPRLAPTLGSANDVRSLKSQADALKASLAEIKAPDLNTKPVRNKIAQIESDLGQLALEDLSGPGKTGVASLDRLQQKVVAVGREISRLSDLQARISTTAPAATRPTPSVASPRRVIVASDPISASTDVPRQSGRSPVSNDISRLQADVSRLSASLQNLPQPKVSVGGIARQLNVVSRELDRLAGKDLSGLGSGGSSAIRRIEREVAALSRQIADIGNEAGRRTEQAARSQGSVRALRSEYEGLKNTLSSIKSPDIKTEKLRGKLDEIRRELDRLSRTDLSKIADSGVASLEKLRQKISDIRPKVSQAQGDDVKREQTRGTAASTSQDNLKAIKDKYESLRQSLDRIKSPNINTDGLRRQFAAVGQELTKLSKADLSGIADGGISSVKKLQREIEKLDSEISRTARRADRERQAGAFAPSSASFVGPMPETRRQAEQRMEKKNALSYDAGAFISDAVKRVTRTITPKVDTSGAVKQVEHLVSAFGRVQDAAMSMNGVLVGMGAVMVGRDIAQTGMAFENLDAGLKAATGSSSQAKVEMERLRAETNRLGLDTLKTGHEYVNFVASIQGSNVDINKAKDAFFATAQAMALLGRGPDQAARAFKALEQFASKGQIMSEELKGQLAEQLPGAFNIVAKAFMMTTEELSKAMENGSISARAFFEVFAGAVKGKFPVAGQIDTAQASFARFNNSLNDIKNTISSGGFLKALAQGADVMARFMNSAEGQKLATDMGGMLKGAIEGLISAFKILADNIELVKGVVITLIGLKLTAWIYEVTSSVLKLGVQLLLLAKYLTVTNPIMGLAAATLAGAAAIYAMTRRVTENTKAQLEHNAALKHLFDLQRQLKSTAPDNKERINSLRAEIDLIREKAREEKKALDEKIKQTEKVNNMDRAFGAATGIAGGLGRMVFGDKFDDQEIARQRRERQMAEQREAAARQAKVTQPTSFPYGPSGPVFEQMDNLVNARAQFSKQIEEQDKLFQAFETNAAAAAELKSQMDMVAQVKLEWEGKLSAEGLKEAYEWMEKVADSKERVAAGPIIQELNTSILDLHKMADAHGKGVDAANAEKVAQEARNRVVQAGVRISNDAAQAIFTLSRAQDDARFSAEMAARNAEFQRTANAAVATTQAVVGKKGNERIAGDAAVRELINQGGDPLDGRPTVRNAELREVGKQAGQTAITQREQQTLQQIELINLEAAALRPLSELEKGQSVEKAKQLGMTKALVELQTRAGGVGLGKVEFKDLSEVDRKFVEAQGRLEAERFKVRQNNKTPRSAPIDHYGEKLRELQESITAEQQLATAYGKGTEAVEQQTRAQSIMNQVHGLSEKLTVKQKAKLEELIGTLYDAKTASAFEGAKMDLREEIAQIQRLAKAEYESAEAVNAETVAQEALRQAKELGVASDKDEVARLEELISTRQRANQMRDVNREIRGNRSEIQALEDEANALKKVGEARIRERAEAETRRQLKNEGVPEDLPRFQEAVTTSGDAAVKDFTESQKRSIESSERQLEVTGRQAGAMSLLGEAYVRRSAELEKEAELIETLGSATDELSQKQIKLAGDNAVATDRLEKMNDGLRQLADSGLTFDQQMREISLGGLTSMEDALVDIMTGTKSVKEAFADMARSIAADLARMAIRQAITIPIAMAMNGMFGGMAGGMGAMGAMGAMGGGFAMAHTGGVIGQDSLATKSVSPAVFNGAPRFHSGKLPSLAPGEMPAILKKDEGVFTPGQMKSLGPAGGNTSITVSPNVNVNMPQGASQEDGERFGKAITRQLQGMVQDEIRRSMRPGGIANPNGMG